MGNHARLAPSAAHRWIPCPGSIRLCKDISDTTSEAAREGTAAHTLAELCFREERNAENYVGETIGVAGGPPIEVDMAMADAVNDYVAVVDLYSEGGERYVEQKVDFSHYISVPNQTGTADVVVVKPPDITVIDLKYGKGVLVNAKNNPQLMLYALGALLDHSLLNTFETVTIVIAQPQLNHIDEWTLTVAELEMFAARAEISAERSVLANEDQPYLNPGEIQCRFCPAKAQCPALAQDVLNRLTGDTVKLQSDKSISKQVSANILPTDTVTVEKLAECMRAIPLIETWCRAIRARVERELLDGQDVDGFKLVRGRRGPRRWADEEQVEELFKSFRLTQDQMYTRKLISPKQSEPYFTDNPRRWNKLEQFITQSDGPISVAKKDDKRPAIEIKKPEDNFDSLI